MHRKIDRLVLFAVLAGLMAVVAPQAGAATDRLSGVGVFDTTQNRFVEIAARYIGTRDEIALWPARDGEEGENG